jgi:hypothetical protein
MRIVHDDSSIIRFAPSRSNQSAQIAFAIAAVVCVFAALHVISEKMPATELDLMPNRYGALALSLVVGLVVARLTQPKSVCFERKSQVLTIAGGWPYLYPTIETHHVREIFDLAIVRHDGGEGDSWHVELWLKWGETKCLAICNTDHEATETATSLRRVLFP